MTDLPRVLSDKQQRRDRSAAKPFAEKLKTLEKMRDRDRSIRSARSITPDTASTTTKK